MADPLIFNWPNALALSVAALRDEWRERDGTRREWASRTSFRLTTSHRPAHTVVGVSRFEREVVRHDPEPAGVFDHKIVSDYIKDAVPSFTVDAEAGITGLLDAEAIRQPILPPASVRQLQPAIAGMFDRLAGADAMLAALEAFWNPCVSSWCGLAVGPATSFQRGQRIAAIAGQVVPRHVTQSVRMAPGGLLIARRESVVDEGAVCARSKKSAILVTRFVFTDLVEAELLQDTLIPVSVSVSTRRDMSVIDPKHGEMHTQGGERRSWHFDGVAGS